jgi:gas vesicle protein
MTESYKPQSGGGTRNGLGSDLTEQAKSLGRDIKSKASDLTDTVTQGAKDQATELGTAAKEIASQATNRVQTAMNEQKSAGADYLGTIAQAVRRAAGEFQSDVPQAAQYIRQAAGQIESVANAVRDHNVSELMGEVQGFARRQPTLFFGGAVILGFAALRFFKSSDGSNSGKKNFVSSTGAPGPFPSASQAGFPQARPH